MTSTAIQWAFLLILFFMCQKYEAVEECDFTKCVLNARSFISDLRKPGGTPFVCRKFLNISGCSDYCMHKYYPSIFSSHDTNRLDIEQFCVHSIADRSNVNWTCIARHTFRLLTCLANVSSMTSNNVHEDAIVKESCRKSLEFLDCPSKVLLPDCKEESVEVVKDMLQFAVDYFMPSSCKDTSIKKVHTMPVRYYLRHEFMELARCLDSRPVEIDSCFRQMIQNEFDLHEFVCREDFLTACVHFQASKVCREVPSVRKLLLKLFSLGGIRCEHSQFAFTHLISHKFQDSVTNKFSTNDKMDEFHSPLNDELHYADFLETSTLPVVKSTEPLHYIKSTEPYVSQSLNSRKNETKFEFNHDINFKNMFEEKNSDVQTANGTSPIDLTKTHASDSLEKNPSKNPSHKDIDYFKASRGANLHCAKTIHSAILLIIFIFKI